MKWNQIKHLLIGKPKRNRELSSEKISNVKALAILSSDALSSVAYGPEQILLTLTVVSLAASWYTLPITIGILILLTALILSYRQIIYAYPHGGGAYTVTKHNLGEKMSLLAGGSLLVDYTLTVAVSISSGADAFIAAFPNFYQHKVLIACLLVAVILILNLRGLTDSATVLSYPVYLFIFGMIGLIVYGTFKVATGQAEPDIHASVGTAVPGVTLFLLLRAFSSGASSLTGIEAISNAVTSFRNPAPKNAVKTLIAMGTILAFMLVGIVGLAYYYGIAPKMETTVLSQLAVHVFGQNVAFYFIQATTVLILILAANTGFTAFPMLAANMAQDKYMPHMFTVRGDRLGYSNSMIILGTIAMLLIIGFKGKTENLIPLYATGVFIPFTLAQYGMVVKWVKERPKGWIFKLSANAIGGTITFVVFMIFLITKFSHVWPILIFLPIVVIGLLRIRLHYRNIAAQLRTDPVFKELGNMDKNLALIPINSVSSIVDKSVEYAKLTADQIIAVHVSFDKTKDAALKKKWKEHYPDIRLVILYSEYRSVARPLARFIDKIRNKAENDRFVITVIVPQFITNKPWQNLLHNQTGILLRWTLFYQKNCILAMIPMKLKK